MTMTDRRSGRDKILEILLKKVVRIVRKSRIKSDWRGQWFANTQLDRLRRIYEQQGYQTTRLYQVGQVERRGGGGGRTDWENVKNKTLLEILDEIENAVSGKGLDRQIGSYLLGRLNAVISESMGNKQEKKK